jgi:hypothetical protein
MGMQRRYGRFVRGAALVGLSGSILVFAKTASAATTVACIGDQLTSSNDAPYMGMPQLLWPGVLQTLLGSSYKVGNDVDNNANTVAAGDCVTTTSKDGPPSIVVIGPFTEHEPTNLSLAMWQADYQKVVDDYLALTPPPTVYVMTPPPGTFAYQTTAETMFVANVVIPAVMNVAGPDAGPGVKLIDLSNDPALATAGMDAHFTLAESAHVAQLVYQAIMAAGSGAASSGAGVDAAASGAAVAASGTSASGTGESGASTGAGGSGASTGGSGTAVVSSGSSTGESSGSASSGEGESGSGTGGSGQSSSGGSVGANAAPASKGGCAVAPRGRARDAGMALSLVGVAAAFSRRRKSRAPRV